MGDLSVHFDTAEMACHCSCGFDKVDPELVKRLEALRVLAGNVSIHINDACRCPAHNKAVGGEPNSFHMQGKAADIKIAGFMPRQIALMAERVGFNGIGTYPTFVHVDVRGYSARWQYNK